MDLLKKRESTATTYRQKRMCALIRDIFADGYYFWFFTMPEYDVGNLLMFLGMSQDEAHSFIKNKLMTKWIFFKFVLKNAEVNFTDAKCLHKEAIKRFEEETEESQSEDESEDQQ